MWAKPGGVEFLPRSRYRSLAVWQQARETADRQQVMDVATHKRAAGPDAGLGDGKLYG